MAAFIPSLITGLSGLAGGLLNKPQVTKQNTDQTVTQNQSGQSSGSTLPVYDPYQLQMRNFLMSQFYNRTNPAAINELVNSSVNSGVNSINDSAGPQQQALQASLAARGLSNSGVAGTAIANQQAQRIAQITNLQAQKPLMFNQIQGQGLTDFASFTRGLPVGSATQGQSTQNGTTHTVGNTTTTGSGNQLGGAVAGIGGALGTLYGQGAFDKANN